MAHAVPDWLLESLSSASPTDLAVDPPQGKTAALNEASERLLCAKLERSPDLLSLDIGGCQLSEDGLRRLCSALPRCPALQLVSLSHIVASDAQPGTLVGGLAGVLSSLPRLYDLSLRGNRITDISPLLPHLPSSLLELDLSCNSIPHVPSVKGVESVILDGNPCVASPRPTPAPPSRGQHATHPRPRPKTSERTPPSATSATQPPQESPAPRKQGVGSMCDVFKECLSTDLDALQLLAPSHEAWLERSRAKAAQSAKDFQHAPRPSTTTPSGGEAAQTPTRNERRPLSASAAGKKRLVKVMRLHQRGSVPIVHDDDNVSYALCVTNERHIAHPPTRNRSRSSSRRKAPPWTPSSTAATIPSCRESRPTSTPVITGTQEEALVRRLYQIHGGQDREAVLRKLQLLTGESPRQLTPDEEERLVKRMTTDALAHRALVMERLSTNRGKAQSTAQMSDEQIERHVKHIYTNSLELEKKKRRDMDAKHLFKPKKGKVLTSTQAQDLMKRLTRPTRPSTTPFYGITHGS
eukprot:Sspe_Gene.98209::Locus_71661_Transcript_1_1_Confidence_1.000_Length_1894::g.98209::m.98209